MKHVDDTDGRRPPSGLTGFRIGECHVAAGAAEPGLHIVATPIGNLGDISLRGLRTLAGVDAVLAEDTRTSKVLLAHYGIETPLFPYHEHNAVAVRPQILGGSGARGSGPDLGCRDAAGFRPGLQGSSRRWSLPACR